MKQNEQVEITSKLKVCLSEESFPSAVNYVLEMFARDAEKVLNTRPIYTTEAEADIVVRWAAADDECPDWEEAYCYRFKKLNEQRQLHIIAHDELGLVYGLLSFTEKYFGIDPFWYWADLPIQQQEAILINIEDYNSRKPKVKYRGWFVNDEVSLIGWTEQYPHRRKSGIRFLKLC
ncbi:hypothetical protein [Gracilibacillus salinarum]|uniref:GNAT family N-acetyltransferase n=1 Tax=Gracilibacillus salinarum TaxID=2932255 RepID=A0ABY4GM54_9BACI|nr:hypothetical protein [Gracilibacillus salinarum]UOQ85260.1 hypothetical protein MUN87_21895 [Gracilibacillus salinarum]